MPGSSRRWCKAALAALLLWGAGSGMTQAWAAGQGHPSHAFQRALAAPPEYYDIWRDQVLSAGEAGAAFLREIARSDQESWLARALAAAMLQRRDDPELVQQFEQEFRSFEDFPSSTWKGLRSETHPPTAWGTGYLVQQGERSVPFLVEALFKRTAREVPDRTVIGHHTTNPTGTALRLLQYLGGKMAAEAVASFLLASPSSQRPSWVTQTGGRTYVGAHAVPAPDAVLAVARLTDDRLADGMIAMLGDTRVQKGAIWVLGELRDPRAVGPLATMLASPGGPSSSKVWMIDALAKIGEPALPRLGQVLLTATGPGQQAAAIALVKIGETAFPTLSECLESDAATRDLRIAVARALRRAHNVNAVPLLLRVFAHNEPGSKWEAFEALEEMAPASTEALERLAETAADEKVRQSAKDALALMEARAANRNPPASQPQP